MRAKKAIIVGATSGIGEALACELAKEGYTLGLAGRNTKKLAELKEKLGERVHTKPIDVLNTGEAMSRLKELIEETGGMDTLIISSGIGYYNKKLLWERENLTLGVNITGFAAIANVGFNYFREQGGGHLVALSSIAVHIPSGISPAYASSKAFVSHYIRGLRIQSKRYKLGIDITDIRPGFVDTPMTEGQKGMFWVAPVEKAARQIVKAIKKKKRCVYITRRWSLLGWLTGILPERFIDTLSK